MDCGLTGAAALQDESATETIAQGEGFVHRWKDLEESKCSTGSEWKKLGLGSYSSNKIFSSYYCFSGHSGWVKVFKSFSLQIQLRQGASFHGLPVWNSTPLVTKEVSAAGPAAPWCCGHNGGHSLWIGSRDLHVSMLGYGTTGHAAKLARGAPVETWTFLLGWGSRVARGDKWRKRRFQGHFFEVRCIVRVWPHPFLIWGRSFGLRRLFTGGSLTSTWCTGHCIPGGLGEKNSPPRFTGTNLETTN